MLKLGLVPIRIFGLIISPKLLVLSVVGILTIGGGTSYFIMKDIATIKSLRAPIGQTPVVTGQISSNTNTPTSQTKTSSSPSSQTASKTTSASTDAKKPSASTTTASSNNTPAVSPSPTSTPAAAPAPAPSPTPTPTPSPSPSNGSCFSAPSSCGYPDATNTGPVAGTVFTKVPEQATSGNGWSWDATNNYVLVSGSNVTINGIETSTEIDVTGSNVTIQNCKLNAYNGMFGISLRHTTNVTVKNCQIAGTDASAGRLMVAIKSIYGDDVNPQSIANNISYVSTGIQYCQGLIQDNYIHDLGYQSGDHLNGTTSGSGCDQLTIQHNTIFNNFDQTDAISLFEDFGQQKNALITNNYVAGGGYTIYGGANAGGIVPINIQITNNRVSDHYYANGGYYGWLAAWNGTGSGNVCSGNVLEHVATGKTEALSC